MAAETLSSRLNSGTNTFGKTAWNFLIGAAIVVVGAKVFLTLAGSSTAVANLMAGTHGAVEGVMAGGGAAA